MSGRYALVIGNTEYVDSGLAQLTAPSKDTEDFARVLKEKDLCDFDEVNTFLNQPEHIIRRSIDEFFDQKKPDDLLVLYFSGHGVRDELGALYLAVKNTNRFRLRSTAIKSDFIREAMDQSRSKRQVLILDCCNSGAFAQGTKAATGVSFGTATAFESGYGRIILTASDSTQFAWEGDKVIGKTDNSLFTHFLVQGLEGVADRDGDGQITVDELYDYAYEQVKLVTPKQTPSKFSSKQQGEIILRQNMRIESIQPVPLPDDLTAAMKSSLPYVREAAVRQLDELLRGRNLGLARSARESLEHIAESDDSRTVSHAALQALEAIRRSEELAIQTNNEERLAAEKLAVERLDEEMIEAERKAKEEVERAAAQEEEEERIAKARLEAEHLAKEKAYKEELERIERERFVHEQAEREIAEKVASEQAQQDDQRLTAEKTARERAERETAEKAVREKVERETQGLGKGKAVREQTEQDAAKKTTKEETRYLETERIDKENTEQNLTEEFHPKQTKNDQQPNEDTWQSSLIEKTFTTNWISVVRKSWTKQGFIQVILWVLYSAPGWIIGFALSWGFGDVAEHEYVHSFIGDSIDLMLGWDSETFTVIGSALIGGFTGLIGGVVYWYLTASTLQLIKQATDSDLKNIILGLLRGFVSLVLQPLRSVRLFWAEYCKFSAAMAKYQLRRTGIAITWLISGVIGTQLSYGEYFETATAIGWGIGWLIAGIIILRSVSKKYLFTSGAILLLSITATYLGSVYKTYSLPNPLPSISPSNADQIRLLAIKYPLIPSDVIFLDFSPDGQTLASTSNDNSIRLWRIRDGSLLQTLKGHTFDVNSVVFSPDGQTLASGSDDKTIRLWRVSDGSLLQTLKGHTFDVNSVAFSPDGQTLASGSDDKTIRLWRVSDGSLLQTLEGHTSSVSSVDFSPDGQTLASGSYDDTIRLWRVVSDGSLHQIINGLTDMVGSVAFSPDGQTLASGSWDDTIRLWRASDGSLLQTFEGHAAIVNSVAFSPDGQSLVSGSSDTTICLWRVSDGSLLQTFTGHKGGVLSVTFSPDGNTIASGSRDGTIRLWGVLP